MLSNFGLKPDYTLYDPSKLNPTKGILIKNSTSTGRIVWKIEIDVETNNLKIAYSEDDGDTYQTKFTISAANA